MSRTDKDVPWWVAADWWEPVHVRCEYAAPRRWQKSWGGRRRECDLPPEPVVTPYKLPRRIANCTWEPVWPPSRRNWMASAPKPFINHVWNGPTRRAARDDAIQAIKEYRATGDVEIVMETDQHRHCAAWLYW